MGLSHREFMRTLPAAIAPLKFQLDDKTISIDHPGGDVQIHLQEMPDRRIGAIKIPKTSVEFRFSGLSQDERAQFIHRFDLHFQRGGG
jgi:hypothetical protein